MTRKLWLRASAWSAGLLVGGGVLAVLALGLVLARPAQAAGIASEQDGLQILRIHQDYFRTSGVITSAGGSLANRDGSVSI